MCSFPLCVIFAKRWFFFRFPVYSAGRCIGGDYVSPVNSGCAVVCGDTSGRPCDDSRRTCVSIADTTNKQHK